MQHRHAHPVLRRAVSTLALLAVAACGGSGNGGGAPPPTVPWRAVPENPAYAAYVAAAADGLEVPELMPLRYGGGEVAAARGFPPPVPPPPSVGGICSFPPAYDLRTLGRVTPSTVPLFSCGTCWTAAATASLESNLAPKELRDFSTAAMQLEWGWDDAQCGTGGNYQIATYYLASWRGPVNDADYPAPGASAPVQEHTQNVFFLPNRQGPLDNCWIKLAVTYLGGVYSAIGRSGWTPLWKANYAYYDPRDVTVHAVAIVGWDDDFDRNLFYCSDPSLSPEEQVPPGNGAFLVKDNAGPDWMDKGFFWVSYYDGTIGKSMAVYTAEPIENFGRMYAYDPYGVRMSWVLPGLKKDYSWQGNVFTALADEKVTAVSFYELYDADMDYQIRVYVDPVGGPTSPQGPAAVVDASLLVPGYFTIRLPVEVPVKKGQRFGVVLRGHRRTDGWPASMALELPDKGFSKVTAGPQQSWVSTDGTTWQDLTTVKSPTPTAQANLCIKAFTKAPLTAKAGLDPGQDVMQWEVKNEGSQAHRVKPVARLFEDTPDGLMLLPDEVVATEYGTGGRERTPTPDGWILVEPGQTITAYGQDDRIALARRIETNVWHVDAYDDTAKLHGLWEVLANLLAEPVQVVSTNPANGAQVNHLGLGVLTVTFDVAVKPGPGIQGISVTSPNGVKSVFPSINGNQLQIATAGPLGSNQLGGTTWTVHVPADAVLSQSLGNPLAKDHDWSFTVTGVN